MIGMHRSKLSTIVIDCQASDLTEATRFWSAALGRNVDTTENPATNKYVKLGTATEELIVLAQKVPHPSRVHVDIETDDIEAEVKRLEALGARRLEKIETWWVMEAPTGHRFCVIRPQRDGKIPDDANQWS
jgi:predicted enzyme related to lactoylglutathione lyase